MPDYRRLRPSGGRLTHLVDAEGVALCGYKPGGKTTEGDKRAGWCANIKVRGARLCDQCEKKFAQAEQLIPFEAGGTLTKKAKMAVVDSLYGQVVNALYRVAQDHSSFDVDVCEFEFTAWISDVVLTLRTEVEKGRL